MPSTSPLRRALTLVLLGAVCVGAATGAAGQAVGAAGSSSACFPTVDAVDRGEAVGDVVSLELLLCFEGSVTVEGPGFEGTATLGDGTHSGHVTLHVNTALRDGAVFGVTSDVLDAVPMNATGNGSFVPGKYTVTVRDGSGDVVDNATFELGPARAQNLTVWRAPRNAAADLGTVPELQVSRAAVAAVDSRRRLEDPASHSLPIATNETLVVRIRAAGLEGAMAAAEGSPLARFRSAVRGTSASITVEQTAETVTPEREPLTLDVLNSSATRVVADADTDTYYLVVYTRRLRGAYEGTHGGEVHVGSRPGIGFAVRFTMRESTGTGESPPDLVSADFHVVEAVVEFPRIEDARVVLAPQRNESILARTTLAPGSVVTVQVGGAIDRTLTRTVRGWPSSKWSGFVVPLDLSGLTEGSTVTIQVEEMGYPPESTTVTGVVRTANASMTVGGAPVTDGRFVVDSVTASHPSIVAVYAVGRSFVGTAAVGPGTNRDVTIPLSAPATNATSYRVVLYRDADRSASLTASDEVYWNDGERVVRTVTRTPSPAPSPTDESERPPTASPTTRATSPTPPTTGTTTPGLGLGSGVLAVLLTIVLVRRAGIHP